MTVAVALEFLTTSLFTIPREVDELEVPHTSAYHGQVQQSLSKHLETATMSWQRLIRFEDSSGKAQYGEPIISKDEDIHDLLSQGSLHASPLSGSSPFALNSTNAPKTKVTKLLALLQPADVPIVKCIGLNYMKHIEEGGRAPPPYPSIFIKARTCVAGWADDVPVPQIAQDPLQADYEGELSIVVGKTGRNISVEDALDHVLGYCASNDVSSRSWQRDPGYAGGVPQWCFSKGFDKYAPLGPMLVSPEVVGDASGLRIQTHVNGESRQDSSTSDLLFPVREIVSFVSQGTTLEVGTVIMTGTPSGVAFGMKPHPVWLRDGDVVECGVEGMGGTRNRIVYERDGSGVGNLKKEHLPK